jgi:hypothetical protein
MVRLFFEDAWPLRERMTLNYGLGWSIDRYLNYDLKKPGLLRRSWAMTAWDQREKNGQTFPRCWG